MRGWLVFQWMALKHRIAAEGAMLSPPLRHNIAIGTRWHVEAAYKKDSLKDTRAVF
jgi:hypothetical protein